MEIRLICAPPNIFSAFSHATLAPGLEHVQIELNMATINSALKVYCGKDFSESVKALVVNKPFF